MSTAPLNGVEFSEEFRKATQKLKKNSDARRRENSRDDMADLLGGRPETTATAKDMDDPLISVLEQFGEPI